MLQFLGISAVLFLLMAVPGFLICCALGMRGVWAMLFSPMAGLSFIALVCQLLALVGVATGPLTVLAPVLITCVMACFLFRNHVSPLELPWIKLWVPLLYVLIGVALGYNLFVSRIGPFDALFQAYDVTWHLNVIQSFVDSGTLTCLHVSPYLSASDAAIAPVDYSGFYPAAWHMLCALVTMMAHAPIPTVINASMFVFAGIVFPLSSLALLISLFPHENRIGIFGAFVCLAFVGFPWYLLVFGPIYPNFAGFCILPSAMALFILIFDHFRSIRECGSALLLLVLGLFGLALCHPNTIFTCILLLAPYCAHRIFEECSRHASSPVKRFVPTIGFVVLVIAIWLVCYRLPFLQDTVTHTWKPYAWAWQEIINILTLQYTFGFCYETAAQYILGTFVVIGFVCAIYRSDKHWLDISYLLACAVLLAAAVRSDEIKQILAGFWYTDPMRLGAVCVISAIPLAALGLDWVYGFLIRVVNCYNAAKKEPNHRLVAGALICAFLVLNFMPGFNLSGLHRVYTQDEYREYAKMDDRDRPGKSFHTTYGDFREIVGDVYRLNEPLDSTEQVFLGKVKQIVPSDALVINNPMDGSFLAYGAYGIRMYYRNFTGMDGSNEAEASKLVRTSLNEYESNSNVKSAVKQLGARYVITLRGKACEASFIDLRGDYNASLFSGITAINEETPGFKLLIQTGPMALYEIER